MNTSVGCCARTHAPVTTFVTSPCCGLVETDANDVVLPMGETNQAGSRGQLNLIWGDVDVELDSEAAGQSSQDGK